MQTLLDSDEAGMPSFLRDASIQQGTMIVHYERRKIIDEETRRGQRMGKERECVCWDNIHEFRSVYTDDLKLDPRSKSPVT